MMRWKFSRRVLRDRELEMQKELKYYRVDFNTVQFEICSMR